MNPADQASLRPHINSFYAAIRANDIHALSAQKADGFPLEWAQTFAPTSLPEYAMTHGSVEAAWWLMAQGVMPERWGVFTGTTWKAFLKKGLQMALAGESSGLPMDAYKNIIKIAIKTTGEKVPGWLGAFWVGSGAQGLLGSWRAGLAAAAAEREASLAPQEPTSVPARKVSPATQKSSTSARPSARAASKPKPIQRPAAISKTVSKPSVSRPRR